MLADVKFLSRLESDVGFTELTEWQGIHIRRMILVSGLRATDKQVIYLLECVTIS